MTRADSEQVEFENRAAELALRKAQRDYDLTRIVAPFAGVVTARMARVQRMVRDGDSLFRVTALAPVLATVRVPETGRRGPPRRRPGAGAHRRRRQRRGAGHPRLAVLDPASGTREVIVQLGPGLARHPRRRRDRAARAPSGAGSSRSRGRR